MAVEVVVLVVVENNRIVVAVVVVVCGWWWSGGGGGGILGRCHLYSPLASTANTLSQFFSVQRKDTTLRCGVCWCFWLSFCVKLTSMDY